MMPAHTLRLERFRPTPLNKLLGHWARSARLKRHDRNVITLEALSQLVPIAEGKRRVSIHVAMGPGMRRLDGDSLWKSCLDSLVCVGLLVNDSPEWCELGTVTQERAGKDEVWGTVVTLEDCEVTG